MTNVIDDILEVHQAADWLFIRWTEPGKFKKRFVKAFRKAEKMVEDAGLKGWYCSSEKDHTTMHKLIQRVGAVPYGDIGGEILFRKDNTNVRI